MKTDEKNKQATTFHTDLLNVRGCEGGPAFLPAKTARLADALANIGNRDHLEQAFLAIQIDNQIGADKFTKVMRKAFSLANDVETSNRKRDRTAIVPRSWPYGAASGRQSDGRPTRLPPQQSRRQKSEESSR